MQQKLITVTLEPDGTSKIDLQGFAGNTCAKVMDDFRSGDRVLTERKKTEYFAQTSALNFQQQR